MSSLEFLADLAINCAANFLIATGLLFWAWAITQGIKCMRRRWRMRRVLTAIRDQDAACN